MTSVMTGGAAGDQKADGCRGELLAQERAGRLSAAGQLALGAHLSSCASCRLTRTVFADFDQLDVVDVRDGARIRKLAEMARSRRPSGVASRHRAARWPARHDGRRLRVFAAAAAVIVCCGSASAAVWWWRRSPTTLARVNTSSRPAELCATDGRAARPARTRAVTPTPVTPVAATPLAATPATRARPRRTIAQATARLAPTPAANGESAAPSAATLLREAGDARRSGEAERAGALYLRLQRDFPASPEAMLSRVALGRLLLDQGSPHAALAQFEAYLRSSHGGTLIPEALYGRGRALARLGDRDEEGRTWQRLLADFPTSAYAPLGRRRLAELR